MMTKIFDVFLFCNELDMLELRLREHEAVDCFIIVESKNTFTGNVKKLNFKENEARFLQWKDKIEYVVIEELSDNNAWTNEHYARNFALNRIKEIASPTDYILNTDLDEIVNNEILVNLKNSKLEHINSLDMDFYYYNCNWIKKKNWSLGTIGPLNLIASLQECRDNSHKYTKIKNAG